jgi:hypothetical protein
VNGNATEENNNFHVAGADFSVRFARIVVGRWSDFRGFE